ncbi:MAG: hypothetical protein KGI67_01215 [Pseudomonadota bacterium]|nr:hypothetical protein [Pseudomonadota bacterium]
MLLRLLLTLIAIVVLLRLLGWRPPAQRPRDLPPPPPQTGDLVQCARCAVYLPRAQALARDGLWYCCHDHRDAA